MKIRAVGGAVLMVVMMWAGTEAFADAGYPIGNPPEQNHGWVNPNHSIGGCNKKGNLCWEINVDPPRRHLPIEVYGGAARNLIANGQITHANMNSYGVFYLDVWSRYYNSSFNCDVNVRNRRYHCVENW